MARLGLPVSNSTVDARSLINAASQKKSGKKKGE